MILKVPYQKLKAYLKEELHYTDEEAVRTIGQLRQADSKVKRAFGRSWESNGIPRRPINGVRVDQLMELRGLDAVAAFLAAAALKRRPSTIQWILTHPLDIRQTTEEDLRLLNQLAQENSWDLDRDVGAEDGDDLLLE